MLLRYLAPLTVLAFVAIACGGDDNGGTVEPLTTPTTAPDTATSEASPTPETASPTASEEPSPSPTEPTAEPGDDAILVECHDLLAPVDKQHRLPEDCVPNSLVVLPESVSYGGQQQLTSEAADALIEMLGDAAAQGYEIRARSTYRSYQTQVSTYQWHVDNLGQAAADRVSARPGHSEHQMGTTADLTNADVGWELSESFGDTDGGIWLAETSWTYGFIVSYPEGTESITGYSYEPWHFRYVGPDVAADVRQSGLTLHEYLLQ